MPEVNDLWKMTLKQLAQSLSALERIEHTQDMMTQWRRVRQDRPLFLAELRRRDEERVKEREAVKLAVEAIEACIAQFSPSVVPVVINPGETPYAIKLCLAALSEFKEQPCPK